MTPDYEKHIGHRLRRVHIGIDKYFSCNSLEKYGLNLTHAQSTMMQFLYAHRDEDIFQKDIENQFQISGATASNTLKGLEKQGVIVRTPMEDDGRKKKITLTQKGTEFHEAAVRNLLHLEEVLIKGLTEEEITIYRDLLSRSAQNLEEETGCCGDEK